MSRRPVLAIDIGGTKSLAALVDGSRIIERALAPTSGELEPQQWVNVLSERVRPWQGRYDRVAVAVTGRVHLGYWSALNPDVLEIGKDFPLQQRFEQALGVPATCCNDAQAAAWGEYRFGAGERQDMVFLTISTGVGAGIVVNGRLLGGRSGLAGHVGQWLTPVDDEDDVVRLEETMAGRWIAGAASAEEPGLDARAVFERAAVGEVWARQIIARSAERVALMCRNLQLLLDPAVIVIGGGIGLAPGYLTRVTERLGQEPDHLRPRLLPALLGADAGVLGVSALDEVLV